VTQRGRPIAVIVHASRNGQEFANTMSNRQTGTYRFFELPPGEFVVSAASGYYADWETVTVPAADPVDLVLMNWN
jgi:hypothetical protein